MNKSSRGQALSRGLITILIEVMVLVIILPMIADEITDATGVGGPLETVGGVALLIALPSFIVLGTVAKTIYDVVKG